MLRVEAVAQMQRDWVERAKDGDVDAFTQLVKMSAPRLYGVANLILRDPDRAKDAVQEAQLTAWRRIRALRDADAWDAWLHRLTVNMCYRLTKKEKRRTLIESSIVPAPGTMWTSDASADVADREWVHTELGRVDIDQRVVIVLHYYLDLPLREVAEILEIPFGTAASRLHRGLEAMRMSMRIERPDRDGGATERAS